MEIIIVVMIMAVLAAASVPRFARTAQRFRTEQAAFDLVQQLRFTRDRAITSGSTVDWVWDPTAHQGHVEVLTEAGYVPMTGRFAQSRGLPDGLTADLVEQDDDRISFFPDGSSEAASLQIVSPQRTYTITVDVATGQSTLTTGPST